MSCGARESPYETPSPSQAPALPACLPVAALTSLLAAGASLAVALVVAIVLGAASSLPGGAQALLVLGALAGPGAVAVYAVRLAQAAGSALTTDGAYSLTLDCCGAPQASPVALPMGVTPCACQVCKVPYTHLTGMVKVHQHRIAGRHHTTLYPS